MRGQKKNLEFPCFTLGKLNYLCIVDKNHKHRKIVVFVFSVFLTKDNFCVSQQLQKENPKDTEKKIELAIKIKGEYESQK